MKLRNGAIINDRYIIDEKIGSGGMAIVYRATDTKLDRTVTLKVMREDYIQDDEFIERFYTEAQAAARLNHPNIVKVYDVDRIGDILFIVMEYINGITLKEAIRARKMFTNEEVLGVSIQIASAIDCAHKNQIVHRDIKPQNILLTPMGEVKVTDFGIARAANAKTTTATATTLGSVHYFSPEQARGGYVDHKSDIYALGITMFEMASGMLPFDDETVVTIALKHINDDLPDLKAINPNVSDSVVQIINKATEKSQIKRYESAEVMGMDLKKALANESLGSYRDYEDLSLTQTLKISQEDMNQIRANGNKNVDIENVSDEYRDDVKVVQNVERQKYQERQRENLRGRQPQQTNRPNQTNRRPQKNYTENNYIEDDNVENEKKPLSIVLYAVITGIVLSLIVGGFIWWGYKQTLRSPMDVPDLTNMTVEQATELGKKEGFDVLAYDYEESDTVPEGMIIAQDYQVGDEFYAGLTIKVTVSTGSGSVAVTVPDVVGLKQEDAIMELENLGFVVKVRDVADDEYEEGRVAQQIPEGNVQLNQGSNVSIYVSTGKVKVETATVPNLVGLTEEQARNQLKDAQLQVSVSYKSSSTIAKDNVISQSLAAGNEVDIDTKVALVVSTGPETVEPEKPVDNNTDNTNNGNNSGNNSNTSNDKVPVTKTIVVDQTMIPSGYETVFVKVVSNATGEVLYEKEVGVNDFPINIKVTGTGTQTFSVYTKVEGGKYELSTNREVKFES